MKKNFSYQDRILAEQLFDNEFEKIFMNLRIRIKNSPPEQRTKIIEDKEKEIMKKFVLKYII